MIPNFRAWDGKKMRYDIAVYQCGSWKVLENCPDTNDYMLEDVEWDVMMSTGRTDKHGKEIFDGDILFWDGSIIGVVKFENAEFICGEGVNARALCAISDDLEIIGDIYTSPELME